MYCPIFQLGELVRWSGHDFQEMAVKVSPLLAIKMHLKTPVLMSFVSLVKIYTYKVSF